MNKTVKILAPTGVAAALAAVAGPLAVAALTTPTVSADAPEFSPVTAPVVQTAAAEVATVDAELAVGEQLSFGDGTHVVGEGVQPGTYTSSGTERDCYWERTSGTSGALEEIISNDIAPNPVTVTIEPGDVGFVSQGCGTWFPEGSAPPAPSEAAPEPEAPAAQLPPVVDDSAPAPAPADPPPAPAADSDHDQQVVQESGTFIGVGSDGRPLASSASKSVSGGNNATSGAKASGGNDMYTNATSNAGPGKATSHSKAVITGW